VGVSKKVAREKRIKSNNRRKNRLLRKRKRSKEKSIGQN